MNFGILNCKHYRGGKHPKVYNNDKNYNNNNIQIICLQIGKQ